MNENITKLIITLSSSTLLITLITKIFKVFFVKDSKEIDYEDKKLEYLFSKVDSSLAPFLFMKPDTKELPPELKDLLEKISKIIEDNPIVGLSLGTRFKEKLRLLQTESKSKRILKKRIQNFSIYYSYELKKCKATLKFPRYSLIYPQSFLPKFSALILKIGDLFEDYFYGLFVLIIITLIFLMTHPLFN